MGKLIRSGAFSAIPERKRNQVLLSTLEACDECSKMEHPRLIDACDRCHAINKALMRFEDANIPLRYWHLSMEKNFHGDAVLLDLYKKATEDLSKTYDDGLTVCFAGPHGVGKTMTTAAILKNAAVKGYNCLYVTLSDIVAITVSAPADDKYYARKELLNVDFLVIDEFDPRYMPTGTSSDLFGRTMEDVLRRRAENQLPLFMCTNSPNVVESFEGAIKYSIESLMNYAQIIPVLGTDFRKGDR